MIVFYLDINYNNNISQILFSIELFMEYLDILANLCRTLVVNR